MIQRKGELTPAAVDRGWPHQVAVPEQYCCGKYYDVHVAFCADLSLCDRGHTVGHDRILYRVFCFADAEHARSFREAFGGAPFYPEDRGKGLNWMRWDRPPGDVRRLARPTKRRKTRMPPG